MKIYTDETFKIVAIDDEPSVYAFVYELKESPFPVKWSMDKILTYHYQLIDGEVKIYP